MNSPRKSTILVVGDEATNLGILFEHLRNANFRVLVAEDGANTLERVKRSTPDIILLDVMLPDMDGFELCRLLKKKKATQDIPIIFLTVRADTDEKVKAFDLSAVDYITKPFESQEVIARINNHLTIHNQRKKLEAQIVQLRQETAEHKQQEETNRSLLLLLDTLDGECFIKDKEGIYQYVNKAFETQFGVKREDVIGKDDDFVFGPETGAILRENDKSIMAGKKLVAIEESTNLQGQKFVVYLTNKTPIIDKNGNVSGICGVGIDITDQKEIEKQLRLSEEKYRVLVENTHDVVYAVGVDGIIVYISQQIAQYGYSPEDVIGKHASQFIAPEYREASLSTFRELTKTGESLPTRIPYLNKDGSYHWVEVVANNIYDDSRKPVQRVGVMRNINDQIEIENALTQAAASAERERLARELHDSVTQTLYSVAAIAEALPRIWERNQQEAQAGLGELTTLTNAALAEMRTLLLELRPGALEKQSLAELLHQLVRGLLGRTRLPVNLSVDDDCSMPPEVQTALYRITQEALNNIVKHARASQVQVSLECEPGLVKLLISDDGVGFNPQSVTSNRLGLDIMPERAHAIGAEFEIDSQPDRGTHINVLWQDQQEGEKNG